MTERAMPLLTIAMPVWNGGSHLPLAVQSIIEQSFVDWELWIADDGSTDGAVDKLDNIGDQRIKILSDGRNLGLAVRLNQIIGAAETRYIARMDHDDIAHPDRLRLQIAYLEEHPECSLVACRCASISETGAVVGQLPFAQSHTEICRRPWLGFSMAHPSWIGRTHWFKAHKYADPAPYCCEDQELLLRASSESHYHSIPEIALAYRVRTKTPFAKLARTRLAMAKVQVRHFVKHGQYLWAAMSILALCVRMGSDMLRSVVPGLRQDLQSLTSPEIADWTFRLESLTKRGRQAGVVESPDPAQYGK